MHFMSNMLYASAVRCRRLPQQPDAAQVMARLRLPFCVVFNKTDKCNDPGLLQRWITDYDAYRVCALWHALSVT